MRRRDFITLVGGAAAVWPLAARAQATKVARIGFLRQAGPHEKQFNAFREGLSAAGYVEGQTIVIEQRYAAGAYERLSGLARELVRSNVDVIVVDGTAAAKACKDATSAIPVVFALALDPVVDGLAASFAHPGGNLTGLTMAVGYGLALKRLELLKDIRQGLSRVAVLRNPGNPTQVPYLGETVRAASALGLEVRASRSYRSVPSLRGNGGLARRRSGDPCGRHVVHPARAGGRVGVQEQITRRVSRSRICCGGRACFIRSESARPLSSGGELRG